MKNIRRVLLLVLLLVGPLCSAQEGWRELSFEDMNAFHPQAGNWFVVGNVTMDRTVDIHHTPPSEPASNKKLKKKKEVPVAQPAAVSFQQGTGILLNMNDQTKKDNLITSWEHGDIEIRMEVMLPKGSNSGIYLQGRYEVQLFDSYQQGAAKFSDMGGIYRNWESQPGKIYMGKAPLANAAKAPGLWQTLTIAFKAPRFDASGNKVSNAEFIEVMLNGVRIHDHVQVPLPTGGSIENNEVAQGPLMIQGDHGPVAFRNVRFKHMDDSEVAISALDYKTYHGEFASIDELKKRKPNATGLLKEITCEVAGREDGYGILFNGTLDIPKDDNYTFQVTCYGGAILSVNNQTLIAPGLNRERGVIRLAKGSYPFELLYAKHVSWLPSRLAVLVRTETTYPKPLHSFGSFPPGSDAVSPIFVHADEPTRLLRAFLDFNGDPTQRLTHTIAVGDPKGVHYIYDLKAGTIACVWRGEFVDATPMWHDRGDGSYRPRGMVEYLFNSSSLAILNPDQPFPAVGDENDFKGKGYTVEPATGRPTFHYIYRGVEVKDRILPDASGTELKRELTLSRVEPGMYFKLGAGRTIRKMPDGSYGIDDQRYYIKTGSETSVAIRKQGDKQELLVPVTTTSLTYSIIW